MTLTRTERRWVASLMEAYAPSDGPGVAPAPGQVDFISAAERMLAASTPRSRLGLRLGIWLAAWAPLWLTGRLATVSSLDVPARTEVLRKMQAHRALAVRGVAMLLKMVATFAMFRVPELRARSRYDERPRREDTGRRALPVVTAIAEAS